MRSFDYSLPSNLVHHLMVRIHTELQSQPLKHAPYRPQARLPRLGKLARRHTFGERAQGAKLNRRKRAVLCAAITIAPPHFARIGPVAYPRSRIHFAISSFLIFTTSTGDLTGVLATAALPAAVHSLRSLACLASSAKADRATKASSNMVSFMIFYPLRLT